MPHELMCASWPLITTRGRIAFASQSGTVGAAFLDMAAAEHLGVSGFVSLGNRVDVDEAEVLMYFNQDPHTQVIALYLEGVKRASYFLDALREAEKPVVILKAGRTLQGSRAAESHTKSMAGTDAIYDALFRKYRVHRADTLEELFDFAKALAYLPKPKGKKLMISTSSGGAAILAIDEAEKHGLSVPEPNPILKERLREMLPAHCAVGNPVDLTGDAISAPDLYKQVMDKTRGDYDTQVVIFGDPIPGASQQVTPGASELVVFLGGADVEREERQKFYEAGIPVFPTPERGIAALAQFFRFDPRPAPAPGRPPVAVPEGLILLPPPEAAALIAKAGIPAAAAPLALEPEQAVELARGFGYPVAMKIASPQLAHKTDMGGVYLGLENDEEVRQAYQEIMDATRLYEHWVTVHGVSVSPMAKPGGLEVILGTVTDPQYGPTLMFGLGGVNTEIYQGRGLLYPARGRRRIRRPDEKNQGLPPAHRLPGPTPPGHQGPAGRHEGPGHLCRQTPGTGPDRTQPAAPLRERPLRRGRADFFAGLGEWEKDCGEGQGLKALPSPHTPLPTRIRSWGTGRLRPH